MQAVACTQINREDRFVLPRSPPTAVRRRSLPATRPRRPGTLGGVGGQESRGQRQRLHMTGRRSGRDEAVAGELDSGERTVDEAAGREGRDVACGLKI